MLTKVSIALTTEHFAAGLFDMILNEPLYDEQVVEMIKIFDDMVEQYNLTKKLTFFTSKSKLADMIGEGGHVHLDVNLTARSFEEIDQMAGSMIDAEDYNGFIMCISKGEDKICTDLKADTIRDYLCQ
jgi:hypothetical protein